MARLPKSSSASYGVRWWYDTDDNSELMPTIRRVEPDPNGYAKAWLRQQAEQEAARMDGTSRDMMSNLMRAIKEEGS